MADSAETVKKAADMNASAMKAAADKARARAETFQTAGAKAFREGVDKSVAGLAELNVEGKKNLEAVVESAAAAQKGAEALSSQALAFSNSQTSP